MTRMEVGETRVTTAITVTTETAVAGEAMVVEMAGVGEMVVAEAAIRGASVWPEMKYRQEYYKGKAEDNGEVLSTHEMVQSPFGQFDDALLTRDTAAIEPNVLEYKLYARGVGPVLTLGVSGGPGSREELLNRDTASQKETREGGTVPLGTAR